MLCYTTGYRLSDTTDMVRLYEAREKILSPSPALYSMFQNTYLWMVTCSTAMTLTVQGLRADGASNLLCMFLGAPEKH